jgi:hypothetical protein
MTRYRIKCRVDNKDYIYLKPQSLYQINLVNMKKSLLLTLLGIAIVFSLPAQTKKEKIAELHKLMKTDSVAEKMMETMMQMKTPYSSDKRKDSLYRILMKGEMAILMKTINENYMVDIYDRYFTSEEVQAYIDFYKTPAGQKMVNTGPAMQKDLMAIMMSNDLMGAMKERMQKKMAELNF